MKREIGLYEPESATEPIYLYGGKYFESFMSLRLHLLEEKGFSIRVTEAIMDALPKLTKEDAKESFKQSGMDPELYSTYFEAKPGLFKRILNIFK